MIQLTVLTGKKAGSRWIACRFPSQIGRAMQADFRLDDDGVWDQHLELDVRTDEGAVLSAASNAFTAVNGNPVQQSVLRNGDLIEIGSVRILFGLSPTRQYSLYLREALTWLALAALGLTQVGIIYWLAAE